MRGPTTTAGAKVAPASRDTVTYWRANRPKLMSAFVSPYETPSVPPYAETSTLTPCALPLSRLIRLGDDQDRPSVDVDSSSSRGSMPLHAAYIWSVTGSIVADGRQHRMPTGPPPTSWLMTPPSVQVCPPSREMRVTCMGAGGSASAALPRGG